MSCVVLPGVNEASWTAENKKALDGFIVDTTITTLLVYLDGDGRLQVDSSVPLLVSKILNNLNFIFLSSQKTVAFLSDRYLYCCETRERSSRSALEHNISFVSVEVNSKCNLNKL